MLFLITAALVVARIGAVVMIMPVFNTMGVPKLHRLAIALCVAVIVAPVVPDAQVYTLSDLLLGMIGEVLVGVVMGGTVGILFGAISMANRPFLSGSGWRRSPRAPHDTRDLRPRRCETRVKIHRGDLIHRYPRHIVGLEVDRSPEPLPHLNHRGRIRPIQRRSEHHLTEKPPAGRHSTDLLARLAQTSVER